MEARRWFEEALLAEASYSTVTDNDGRLRSLPEIQRVLKRDGFAPAQVDALLSGFRIVTQQPNTTLSGFSATLFQRLDGAGQPMNAYVIAVRGTELSDVRDLVVDGFLAAARGVPQYTSLKDWYAGLLADGTLPAGAQLAVTGHSLGGFLAQLFAADFAPAVTEGYAFNAPGIRGVPGQVLEAFGLGEAAVAAGPITNIYAAPGVELVAGLGQVLGTPEPVFIEDAGSLGGNLLGGNHAIRKLTDSLAVHALVQRLDPALTVASISGLLEAAAPHGPGSLQVTVDALAALLAPASVGSGAPPTAGESSPGLRESLYRAIGRIDEAAAARGGPPLRIVSLNR